MAVILNIETATRNCSVALARDGQTLASRDYAGEGYSHAEKLHVFIDEVLREASVSSSDLDALAVGRGPGSYTGLRIGVSSVKGFCYALGIPLIAVDSLQILARQIEIESGLIIPMIDARRMEVYSAVYDKNYNEERGTEAEILTAESYADYKEDLFFIGDCQEKVRSVLTADNFHFVPEAEFPRAIEMSVPSYEKFLRGDFSDIAYFEPFYLKDFIAGKPSK